MRLAWSRSVAWERPYCARRDRPAGYRRSPVYGPRVRLLQAKDVPEDVILEILRAEPKRWFTHYGVHGPREIMPSLPHRSPELAAFPHKVLRAKLASMMRRGLIDGCDCGCRGDWHIPALFYGD